MVDKKAQMKIQQTAFMLIALTLFFVLVGLFIVSFQLSDLRRSASDLDEKNAILLVSKLANTPELSCGNSFGKSRDNCVDADKALLLSKESSKYKDFWGVSNIKIKKIYPIGDEELCTSSNYPECDTIVILEGSDKGIFISNFVALCRKEVEESKTYDKCELDRLMVSYEKKYETE